VRLFRCMGSPAIIRLYCCIYFNHFNNHNHVGVTALGGGWRAGGSPIVKDRDTLIEQSVTRINEAIVKQVVYDEILKQIRTVRHSFNTTGKANYRVQLAVPQNYITK